VREGPLRRALASTGAAPCRSPYGSGSGWRRSATRPGTCSASGRPCREIRERCSEPSECSGCRAADGDHGRTLGQTWSRSRGLDSSNVADRRRSGSAVARAIVGGAREIQPVHEEHGWLVGRIEDPFGHHWEIGKPLVAWPPERGARGDEAPLIAAHG
jgi:hypothetical protein